MTIDAYTHFFPTAYARAIRRTATRAHPDVPDMDLLMKLFPNLCDLSSRVAHMDRHEISMQVLTPLPIPPELFTGDKGGAPLARDANNAMAEEIESQNRFVGVALLCFEDPEEAAGELERAVRQAGLKGGMIFTNIQGRPLDSPDLFCVYEKAVELDVPLWIHPISWNYYDWVRDYLIWQIFGWPIDTTLAMARLVYGGVLEKYPHLKLITHHAGGTVPYLIGRVVDTYDQNEELTRLSGEMNAAPAETNTRTPLEYFRMFYGDTALSGIPGAMRCAYDMFGAGRLLFASDYPFGPDAGQRFIGSNLEALGGLGLDAASMERVRFKNSQDLLKL